MITSVEVLHTTIVVGKKIWGSPLTRTIDKCIVLAVWKILEAVLCSTSIWAPYKSVSS